MEFFEQGVCTSLESFPSVRQMKEEQSMIVRKIVEGRDVYANRIRTKFCLVFVKLLERQRFVPKISFGVCRMSVKVQYDGTSPVFEK